MVCVNARFGTLEKRMQQNTIFLAEGTAATGAVRNLVPASRHQPALVCRGEGFRLHGSRNDGTHLRFCPSSRRAPCKSSEHPDRNFASRRSCLVLRLWQLRHSQRRLSRVNASRTPLGLAS